MYSTYEVVVAGGGPAGAATAISLAGRGLRVALIDAGAGQGIKIGEGLPPAAKPLLRDLGVLERVGAGPHLPCVGNQSAWGDEELTPTDFIRDPQGMGWHLDRLVFDAGLRERAREVGVLLLSRTRLTSWRQRRGGGWLLNAENAGGLSLLACRWLVDAGGRNSRVARGLGVEREVIDRLAAFATVYHLPEITNGDAVADPDRTTLVEAVADGWWYSAPIPGRRRVVVFHTDSSNEQARYARDAHGFAHLLGETRHISARVHENGYRMEQTPRAFAANTTRLKPVIGEDWLATGDAAASFDPLSSQGIMTALYSGVKAGARLGDWFNGDARALDGYASDIARVHDVYLEKRRQYYAMETRWREREFWRERLEPANSGSERE